MDTAKSFLSFKIDSEYYAASVDYVHNIIEYTEITKMPEMPPYMLGVINLRGQVLPVIDSRIKFGLAKAEITTNTCILVMEVEIDNTRTFVGALVDSVAEVIELKQEDIKETPEIGTTIKNHFIDGVYHDSDKFIMLLNMNNIFSGEEIAELGSHEDGVSV